MKPLKMVLVGLLVIFLLGCEKKPEVKPVPPELMATDPTRPIVIVTQTEAATEPSGTEPMATESEILLEEIKQHTPSDGDFVRIQDYIPDILVELPYGGTDNFTGQRVYDFSEPFLRYGTVKKLMQVQEEMKQGGLLLKIWDAFRPTSVQFVLWDAFPDATHVSNPEKGFSSHSRGNTVDVTLVDASGTELTMPTGFDDFTELANRDYSDCPQDARANAMMLEQVMTSYGFNAYFGEWWHFTDSQTYPVDEDFQPTDGTEYYAECNEYISLRQKPDTSAAVITTIPAGKTFEVLAWYGEFAMVNYRGVWGYVLRDYIRPVQ